MSWANLTREKTRDAAFRFFKYSLGYRAHPGWHRATEIRQFFYFRRDAGASARSTLQTPTHTPDITSANRGHATKCKHQSSHRNINILQFNIDRIQNKHIQLKHFLHKLKIHICIIRETKLRHAQTTNIFKITLSLNRKDNMARPHRLHKLQHLIH